MLNSIIRKMPISKSPLMVISGASVASSILYFNQPLSEYAIKKVYNNQSNLYGGTFLGFGGSRLLGTNMIKNLIGHKPNLQKIMSNSGTMALIAGLIGSFIGVNYQIGKCSFIFHLADKYITNDVAIQTYKDLHEFIVVDDNKHPHNRFKLLLKNKLEDMCNKNVCSTEQGVMKNKFDFDIFNFDDFRLENIIRYDENSFRVKLARIIEPEIFQYKYNDDFNDVCKMVLKIWCFQFVSVKIFLENELFNEYIDTRDKLFINIFS